jgi:hypothetical protein
MAIDDDPVKALKKHFELEAVSTSPIPEMLSKIASILLPLHYPWDKVAEGLKQFLGFDAAQKDRLLVDTIATEVSNHAERLERGENIVADHEVRLSPDVLIPLLVDGMRKAEQTRAAQRVRRIGRILTNAAFEVGPPEADEIEEMMRVAMELSDRDVDFLGELVRIEGRIVRAQGRAERHSAYTIWEQGRWGTRVDPELDSVFSKLESYGLVARLAPPNNLNIMADVQNRYVLLPKGLRFADLIKSRAAAM